MRITKLVGTPWPGYRPGALAWIQAVSANIGNFVLVDVLTGQPFNRPAGTTGTNDTPHTQPVTAPGPAPATSAPPASGHTLLDDIDGTYRFHYLSHSCDGRDMLALWHDDDWPIIHHGDTLTVGDMTGSLNADGSFSVANGHGTSRGLLAAESGRTVIRNGKETGADGHCQSTYTATK
jgi:hypothetical protein